MIDCYKVPYICLSNERETRGRAILISITYLSLTPAVPPPYIPPLPSTLPDQPRRHNPLNTENMRPNDDDDDDDILPSAGHC